MLSTSAVHTTCTANCHTFVWGGAGEPTYDDDGLCWCRCDGEGWSNANILGRPSCVPVAAHLTLGWVGLSLSVAGLFHAAFHLFQQIRFHQEQLSAEASPIEQCRRQLHITALLGAILSMVYFVMVVEDELWLSMLMLGVSQIPAFINIPVLSTRMWIYTNDRRVIQGSPAVVRASRWLETRKGQYTAYSLVLVSPVVAIILTCADLAVEAVMVLSGGILVLATAALIAFWVCGRSLLKGIDESVQQQQRKRESLLQMGVERVTESGVSTPNQDRSGGDVALLAARKKVKMVLVFAVISLAMVDCMLVFSMTSRYGAETPLLFFIAPTTLVPLMWNIVNVTVHRGRTRRSARGSMSSAQSKKTSRGSILLVVRPYSGPRQVLPTVVDSTTAAS